MKTRTGRRFLRLANFGRYTFRYKQSSLPLTCCVIKSLCIQALLGYVAFHRNPQLGGGTGLCLGNKKEVRRKIAGDKDLYNYPEPQWTKWWRGKWNTVPGIIPSHVTLFGLALDTTIVQADGLSVGGLGEYEGIIIHWTRVTFWRSGCTAGN